MHASHVDVRVGIQIVESCEARLDFLDSRANPVNDP